ncbi:hypothetical protein O0I10_011433 [Lichtheimia ornata]|uniref:Heterokaryon incompatibility domain-containing protein n=1 Tax=Lichtheimia ornata TaxID=688661 RepID=A0AAD7USR7_9FUNG|nr:uncharacterized protein O0I10_011433 [Lichtheimia ornata]KAJ8652899.1 hypothetical protein O0I10_011433 [Lichtheimia ornata]
MTCDADEYNNPYKININLVDDKDGKRKRFFEKGLGALLDDNYFLLLYVPENGGRMQVVRPASDLFHRKRIIKKINEVKRIPSFYYALSHLWGLRKDNRYLWNEIGEHVDDEQGQPVKPVSMRPEKRDALLALLKDHPDSYWWIDVLCARTDTPLDIMGDIYACCLECIAMIDCEPTLISKIHTMSDAVDEAEKLWRESGEGFLTTQQLHGTKSSQLMELVYTFLQSEWWQRVWTWQEMALPMGDVRFMAETDTCLPQTNTITLNELLGFRSVLPISETLRPDIVRENHGLWTPFEFHRRLSAIYFARESKSHRIKARNARLHSIMMSLMYSNRRCYDPCDYVYGVLGAMQIKIPRMDDPDEVWRHFLSELDALSPLDLSPWIDHADEIDLREVENIGEVYKKLSDIYLEDGIAGILPSSFNKLDPLQ